MAHRTLLPLLCAGLGLLLALAGPALGRKSAAQRRAETRAEMVRSSGAYRWGEGMGASPEAARHDLVTRIRCLITSTEHHQKTETNTALIDQYRLSTRVLSVLHLEGLEDLELPRREGDATGTSPLSRRRACRPA